MSKTAAIVLALAAACAGFAIGLRLGTLNKHESLSSRPSTAIAKPEPLGRPHVSYPGNTDQLRSTFAGKEQRIRELEDELANMRAAWRPPPGAEEQELHAEYLKWRKERRWAEEERQFMTKVLMLGHKIEPSEHEGVPEEWIAELAALLGSKDPDDLMVGLRTLDMCWNLDFDKSGLKTGVLAAAEHEDPSVRAAAAECLGLVCLPQEKYDTGLRLTGDPSPEVRVAALKSLCQDCPEEEKLDLLVPSVNDPSPLVRQCVASNLPWPTDQEPSQQFVAAMAALVRDDEDSVRDALRERLRTLHGTIQYAKDPILDSLLHELWPWRDGPTE